MAYWDSKKQKVGHTPPVLAEQNGWAIIDCHCCGGLSWGGDSPRECPDCDGQGFVFVHLESAVRAIFPGGPLKGRLEPEEVDALRDELLAAHDQHLTSKAP